MTAEEKRRMQKKEARMARNKARVCDNTGQRRVVCGCDACVAWAVRMAEFEAQQDKHDAVMSRKARIENRSRSGFSS